MFGIERIVLYIYLLHIIQRSFDIVAVNITINHNITGYVGKNTTHITCSFSKDINENFLNVAIIVRNSNGIFPIKEPVAVFPPDKVALLPPSGDYLSGRVTLTNITKVSTTATLRFDNLECEDEKEYKCTFNYVNDFGVVIIDESEPTRLFVNAYPLMPTNISSFIVSTQRTEQQENKLSNLLLERNTTLFRIKQNCSLSYWSHSNEILNLIYLQSTKTPLTFFREGDTVIFTCTGNIGKPPGRLIWQKMSPQLERPVIYSNETNDVEFIPYVCSFRGTSNLTVLLSAEDLNAQFRCFEESQANILKMYVETAPLDVHYHVRNIKITKQPNQKRYDRKTAKLILTCNASGNPKPTYAWYKDDNTRCIIALTNLYIIEHVVQNNSGVYVCEAYNSIDGIDYKANYSVKIEIVEELVTATGSLEIFTEYAAYVILVICVVLITMICFAVRKRHCKRENGKIRRCLNASVIYSEVDEHAKLKYRLKNSQATSLNPEPADVENDFVEGANEIFGDPRFKYNMITGKLEVYSKM